MGKVFGIVGDAAAVVGVLACLIAGLARLNGAFYLAGFELLTVFVGGVGLMVLACLVKIQQLLVAQAR